MNLSDAFVFYDLDTLLWKTYQLSFLADLEQFSENWPKSGMMRNGRCYQRPCLAHHISGKGFSLLPTPCASEGSHKNKQYLRPREKWETCSSLIALLIGAEFGLTEKQSRPKGRYIFNPEFAEWLMGVPSGWTDLDVSETELSRTAPCLSEKK